MQVDQNRRRSQRIEVRATPEDRALIDRAVAAAGTNVTAFVLSSVTTAARQVSSATIIDGINAILGRAD